MAEKKLVLSVTLADCTVQTFRSGGPGGQNQNKRDTGVRIIHEPSGARGESREERSQLQNKKAAWRRMCDTKEFKLWVRLQTGHMDAARAEMERRITNQVDRDTREENILVETFSPEEEKA